MLAATADIRRALDALRLRDAAMFELFYSSGLRLAELMGGSLQVDSREGQGSTFTLRLPLTTAGPITDWVVKQGLDRARFTEIFNSAAIGTKAQQAASLQEAYAVEGTPAMGVAGRYYISGQGPRTLTVASALIAEVRKA